MIRCKTCGRIATITKVAVNEFASPGVKTWGSCKPCGYVEQEDRVDYDDWEELGVDM